MADQQHTPSETDLSGMPNRMAEIAARSQKLVQSFLDSCAAHPNNGYAMSDPLNIGAAFLEMTARMMADPFKMAEAQVTLWQDYLALWQNAADRVLGYTAEPVARPARDDRRFKDDTWNDGDVFDFIKQSYLLTARWIQSTVREVEGLDEKTAQKVDFYTRQFVDALSPSNFVMTNPEVLRTTLESGGENLIKGLENLLEDLERGDGQLKIKMTDLDAFKVGENLAVTPGKVVFRNELMELIQYAPSTETVRKTPLLIVPPWINKYYILDLRPDNSFIKWAVDQGNTVFVISWINPDTPLAEKCFDDYLLEGPLAALDAVKAATGEDSVHAVGYCIGGTLLASTLAYMAATGDDRIRSATYLTTMVDFAEPGELGVFIDEVQLENLDRRMRERGYLEGGEMATTFNMMRDNDLIWSFVVNNYLLGKDPFPFDLLFWNSDSTRMPAAMHSFYLRKMYLENLLSTPGGIELAGQPIDLSRIKTPSYVVGTREDHIAPWKSAYAATRLYSGPVRFVLAASGHIAGIVNPPARNKYCYWTNSRRPANPETWIKGAKENAGSWWPNWDDWLARNSGKAEVPARVPGDGDLKPLADAPGTYVLMKAK